MKIDGDQQSTEENAQREIGRSECEPRHCGPCKKNPVGAGNEFQYAFLNLHDLEHGRTGISEFAALFNRQPDVAKTGGYSQQ